MNRTLDIAVATICLFVLAPLLVVIAGIIALSDGGPVIYRGVRVGRAGHHFQIFKFRTMRQGASGARGLTVADDPRVTRLGRLLRCTKLDELPQLINVVRGEMSLVGPRPEAPQYVVHYTAEQLQVLSVRPGVTGASQIAFSREERMLCGPDPEAFYIDTVMPAKLAIDLEYVRDRSLWLDFKILALTLIVMVRPMPPLAVVNASPLRTGAHDG